MNIPVISITPRMQAYIAMQIELLSKDKLIGENNEGPFLAFQWVHSFSNKMDGSKVTDQYIKGIIYKPLLAKFPRAQIVTTDSGKHIIISPSPSSLSKSEITLDLNDSGDVIEAVS